MPFSPNAPFSPCGIVRLLPLALLALGACDKRPSAPRQADAAHAPPVTAPPATPPATPSVPPHGYTVDRSHRGEAAPADGFAGPDGQPMTLARFKGRPVLVNLWATWCAPCVREMPSLDALATRTEGRLLVAAINQDADKQATDPVPGWWAKANLPHLLRYRDGRNNLGFAYGGGMLPTSVLYDAGGREVWRLYGAVDWTGAEAATLLQPVLGATREAE